MTSVDLKLIENSRWTSKYSLQDLNNALKRVISDVPGLSLTTGLEQSLYHCFEFLTSYSCRKELIDQYHNTFVQVYTDILDRSTPDQLEDSLIRNVVDRYSDYKEIKKRLSVFFASTSGRDALLKLMLNRSDRPYEQLQYLYAVIVDGCARAKVDLEPTFRRLKWDARKMTCLYEDLGRTVTEETTVYLTCYAASLLSIIIESSLAGGDIRGVLGSIVSITAINMRRNILGSNESRTYAKKMISETVAHVRRIFDVCFTQYADQLRQVIVDDARDYHELDQWSISGCLSSYMKDDGVYDCIWDRYIFDLVRSPKIRAECHDCVRVKMLRLTKLTDSSFIPDLCDVILDEPTGDVRYVAMARLAKMRPHPVIEQFLCDLCNKVQPSMTTALIIMSTNPQSCDRPYLELVAQSDDDKLKRLAQQILDSTKPVKRTPMSDEDVTEEDD